MIKLRQMRGRLIGLSKVILSSALLLFITVACEDDESGQNTIGNVLYIDGPSGVTPMSTQTFTASEAGGSISWSVTGNATLGTTDGLTAEVTFGAVGTATVNATGNGLEGARAITINSVDAALLEEGGSTFSNASVNNGGSETITLEFASPLASAPTLAFEGDFTNGTISSNLAEVAGSGMTKFIATITGGTGNGQLMGRMLNVTAAADYGGGVADTIRVDLHAVDNVKPLAKFENPDEVTVVNKGGSVKFMVSASEAIRAVKDSMKLALDYDAGSAGTDTLLLLTQSEDDASVWYTTWTNTADGDGNFTATLDQSTVIDIANNDALWDPATSMFNVLVDNTAPTAFTLTATETDPVDEPRVVDIVVGPEEGGSTVHWIWLPYNSQFLPESPADFEGEGADNAKFVASAGNFKLFYLEVDAAGNYDTNTDGTAKVKRFPALTGDQEEGDKDASIEIK
ncbi:hypothetical protein [Reichenbachiella sp.]|uniref:hypothetical protein n=1 Tax=Reichenbachiella sp. TaxID=2184521 RepID=UPI003B5A9AD7